jgi:hypothetical protein
MNTQPNDGGPAFPGIAGAEGRGNITCSLGPNGETEWIYHNPGMTLRDYFAGQALQGYLAGRNNNQSENPSNFQALKASIDCYGYADAMLAARERKECA